MERRAPKKQRSPPQKLRTHKIDPEIGGSFETTLEKKEHADVILFWYKYTHTYVHVNISITITVHGN